MKVYLVGILCCIVCQLSFGQVGPGAESLTNQAKLERVYPNPISDYIFVDIEAESNAFAEIELLDILGNKVQVWERQELVNGKNKIKLQLENFHSGIYLLKVKIGAKVYVTRLRKV